MSEWRKLDDEIFERASNLMDQYLECIHRMSMCRPNEMREEIKKFIWIYQIEIMVIGKWCYRTPTRTGILFFNNVTGQPVAPKNNALIIVNTLIFGLIYEILKLLH